MSRKVLSIFVFVLMMVVALVPQTALAHDGPYICTDEAVPGSCMPIRAHQREAQIKQCLMAEVDGVCLLPTMRSKAEPETPPLRHLPRPSGYGPIREE